MIGKVAIVGLYGSGAPALANVLENLGAFMGKELCPTYAEPKWLARSLKSWWAEPSLVESTSITERVREFRRYAEDAKQEIKGNPEYEMIGASHPLLTLCGPDLISAWGSDTKFLWAFRPLESSTITLARRGWFKGKEVRMQKQLWEAAKEFLAIHQHRRVDYRLLFSQPERQVSKIINYLELNPTPEQINGAIQSALNPKKEIHFDTVSA